MGGRRRVSTFFSDISYSLYLIHGCLGLPLLAYLHPRIGYGNAALVASIASIASAFVVYNVIEKPAINLGRRMSAKRAPAKVEPLSR